MRKLTILTVVMLIGFISNAQYDKWFVEPHFGVTKVRDITKVVPVNYGLSVTKMLNTKFGFSIDGTYSELYNEWDFNAENKYISNPYYSGTFEGIVNVGRVLEFESFAPWYTILAGVGGTYTYSDGSVNDQILHRYSNFHLSASVDNVLRISNNISLMAGLNVITGVNDRPFVPTSTETTSIINFNLGVSVAFGKTKENAYFYIPEPEINQIVIDRTTRVESTPIYNIIEVKAVASEYVFFDHDSYVVNRDGLNAIVKASDQLTTNKKIYVVGYASPPGTDDYNIKLAEKRAWAVAKKLISQGIQEKYIELVFIGEEDTVDGKNVDLKRRVQLIVK